MSSIVEITVIFLAWHLNVWVHSQICYRSKVIEIVCTCEEMIYTKMKPWWYFIQESGYPQFCSTHSFYDCSLANLGCVWNFIVSQWPNVYFRHQMGPWTCEIARTAQWRGWGAPCFLYECWATFLLCLLVQISKNQIKTRWEREKEKKRNKNQTYLFGMLMAVGKKLSLMEMQQ